MGILTADGKWVGPPVLFLRLRLDSDIVILDGNKRLEEYKARGLKSTVPSITVYSHVEAIRFLILHQHPDRAANHAIKYYPQLVQYSSTSLNNILDVGRNKLQPYIRALKDPYERHKLPRRAMGVVKRLRRLRDDVIEGKPLTLNDIEAALGEFLND